MLWNRRAGVTLRIPGSSNGRTVDFGSINEGSNPSPGTPKRASKGLAFFFAEPRCQSAKSALRRRLPKAEKGLEVPFWPGDRRVGAAKRDEPKPGSSPLYIVDRTEAELGIAHHPALP